MEKESTDGKMEIDMKDSLHMTRDKDWGSIFGMTEVFTRVNGTQIG